MDKNKRWREIAVLFLISIAVFGVAGNSHNREQTFNEMQGQMAVADVQAEINSQETADQETESENTSDQEAESEETAERETESEDASEQETESGDKVTVSYPLYEGIQCVCKGGKYGFLDSDGKTMIPFVYDDAAPFVEGLAYFRMGEEYGFMDEMDTPVFYLDCDSVSNFQEGLAYFTIDGKYGYIDQSGEIVIEPVYHDADYFRDGYAIIMKNGGFGVIDKSGREVIEPKYQEIERGGENFVVKEGEKYQILNRKGERLLKSPCEEINNYYYPVVGFRDTDQGICGFAAGENVVYFEEDYEWMSFIPQRELVILRKEDGSYGIKDFQGNTVKAFRYDNLYYNPDDDVFYVTDKGNDESRTVTADEFTRRAADEAVKEKYAKGEELSKDLQYNKLTPRVSRYLEFRQNCTFSMETFAGPIREISLSEWELKDVTIKLYDLGQLGKPALYLCHKHEDSPAVEGFFAVWGEEVICLVTADQGGGSGGGETARLWYDHEEGRLLPGRTSHYGGGVFGASGDVYDLIDGACQKKISWSVFEHAGPEGGEMISTYNVNGERVTEEQYKEVRRRYTRVDIIR